MFVDDNLSFIKSILSFLRRDEKFEIAGIASSGEEAIQRIKLDPPDIILMDLHMPQMNGLQAARSIRKIKPSIKIIIMSLDQEAEYANMAKSAGADGFVVKSRFVEDFHTVLNSILVSGISL